MNARLPLAIACVPPIGPQIAAEPIPRLHLAPSPVPLALLEEALRAVTLRVEAAERALELVIGGRPGSVEAAAALVAARHAWVDAYARLAAFRRVAP